MHLIIHKLIRNQHDIANSERPQKYDTKTKGKHTALCAIVLLLFCVSFLWAKNYSQNKRMRDRCEREADTARMAASQLFALPCPSERPDYKFTNHIISVGLVSQTLSS